MIATHLASRDGSFADSVASLFEVWRALGIADVFRVDAFDLTTRVVRWGLRLISGGAADSSSARSLVDTAPLGRLLVDMLAPGPDGAFPGIARNLGSGALRAVALTASSYTTGRSVTWVEGQDGCGLLTRGGLHSQGTTGCLRVDHVMASASLPFFFPAVQVDGAWYGDGGIRLTAPLSPAVHLGARRIMVVSTRYARSAVETEPAAPSPYPPLAQVGGVLLNATLDMRS